MNKSYKLFIFDFDGTLADTKDGVVAAFQKSLVYNNLPMVDSKQIIHNMGVPVGQMFSKLLLNRSDIPYKKLVEDYRKFYKQSIPDTVKSFPGVSETLQKLKEKNISIAIATSKKTDAALATCKFLGIDQYINVCVGEDMVTHKKPDPEMLRFILKKFALDPKNAVMIGDSTVDIAMGKAISMDTIAVTWGSHPYKLLQSVHPTYLIEAFSDIAIFV